MRLLRNLLLLLAACLLAIAAGLLVARVQAATTNTLYLPLVSGPALPPLVWDSEWADELGVSLERSACPAGCWRLTSLDIRDGDEGAGRHALYVKAYGTEQLADVPFRVTWPDGEATALTKSAPEWGDIALWRCYDHTRGPGPYSGSVGADSDTIHGMGLPQCHHFSFWTEWVWQP